ncbi:Papain family cysteine protease [Chitinophaga sp. CF118]|uniref:C1 family peptidase n=1 Tax=Chitinophaga sp. CF118 TaxID=1884367 RepID=UPI0008DFBDFD|nr:C1 family peptidase [Chitinophaga sp. CF118]SFD98044.1 Papain family cysteine protease [Chitinophaga sp. CF118]
MTEIILKQKLNPFKGRVLNARPDTIDFRDSMYASTLFEVPTRIGLDDYRKAGVPILNQGLEGACTGFGLATVIHYLLRIRKGDSFIEEISPRMLYEMAKKYDEWEGEDYIGSSARGAIKGWHKHGVCLQQKWIYDPGNPDKELTAERADNAARFPLGAYYRVNHKDFTDIHTAMAEVGILYATARVHDGWFNVDADGEIPYEGQQIQGGHAFAMVAYDEYGFWIQNSWGKTWGKDGFARISYDDWAANATDVWVARLGAPILLSSPNSLAKTFSVTASASEHLPFKELRPHVISLGNNGILKETGTFGNTKNDVKRIFDEYIPEITKQWKNKRIVFYAHGGLVPESGVLQRLSDYRQTLLTKEIYPIFFVWHSDMLSTIKGLIQDALKGRQPEEKISSAFDFILDRVDDMLEPLLRLPGKTAWSEMKQNARGASKPGSGGASITLEYLREFIEKESDTGIHLIGHSAGAIFLAPFIEQLKEIAIPVKSCILWAPACTLDDFIKAYVPAIRSQAIEKVTLFTLTDRAEQDDNCFHLYNKSLLYLVSNSFETTARGTALLGMAKFINTHHVIKKLIHDGQLDWIESPNTKASPDSSVAGHHGDFDNDIICFNSTVQRILIADPGLVNMEVVNIQEGDAGVRASLIIPPENGGEAGLRSGANPVGGEVLEKIPIAPSPTDPQTKTRPSKKDYEYRRNGLNAEFKL